jgi:hypothetical protein
VQSADLQGLESEFAARDAAGRGVGPLSPRDSAVVDLGGAHLSVDYGRPFRRGRTIVGEVVPYNQVWRTGANAATVFSTSRPLEIRGVTIPAGAYTLWTLPSPGGWKLIVNRETGLAADPSGPSRTTSATWTPSTRLWAFFNPGGLNMSFFNDPNGAPARSPPATPARSTPTRTPSRGSRRAAATW